MKVLIILKGLPASGKTTWAKEWVSEGPKNRVRVNRDDIRAMFGNIRHDRLLETIITETLNHLVRDLLSNGYSVVHDNTNLKHHTKHWIDLVKDIGDVEVHVKSFNTPLEECINRDKARENSVGERIIQSMHKRYLNGS